ncbi:MAG: phosphoribosylformylglycinamidine cyclo-ligase [Pseudomonadota bacterium]
MTDDPETAASDDADPSNAYAAAGVSVARGDALVDAIKPHAARTARRGALPNLGGFAAAFDLEAAGHAGSLLIASADGVGTKVRLATEIGDHSTVGIDLVAMCVNDILAQGAEPLFFLDYYATAALDVAAAADVVAGIAEGCVRANCALIGGETAEMPGHYAPGDYDLAGFCVGAVRRDQMLPRADMTAGDAVIALKSDGLHSNGFSLVRKLAAENEWNLSAPFEGSTLGAALLTPTRIYVQPVLAALTAHQHKIKGIAHITGGGLTGNIPRILPANLCAEIRRDALPHLPVMAFVQSEGALSHQSMERTFNCGAGLVLVVAGEAAADVIETLCAQGEAPTAIGKLSLRGPHGEACRIS